MSTHVRPGVYTSYEVEGGLRGKSGGYPVGLAAAATGGTAGTVTLVTSYAEAVTAFTGGNLPALLKILLENGAPSVYCCPVANNDYDTAFTALMDIPGIRFMVCDSRDAAVHGKMKTAITGGDEKSKYRIGVVESGDSTRAALVSDAQALNCERMVLLSHHCGSGVIGAAAAAVCGIMAGETDPALPLNGSVLTGIGDIGTYFTDADMTLLIEGGVLPLETLAGQKTVVRGVTTRTLTGAAADTTWREVNTMLIIDTVLPALRDSLRAAFSRAKNNSRTRDAIRTRVIIELEEYLRQEIIEGYDNVTAVPDGTDPTVCTVSFSFTVAHGLNVIELNAHITV